MLTTANSPSLFIDEFDQLPVGFHLGAVAKHHLLKLFHINVKYRSPGQPSHNAILGDLLGELLVIFFLKVLDSLPCFGLINIVHRAGITIPSTPGVIYILEYMLVVFDFILLHSRVNPILAIAKQAIEHIFCAQFRKLNIVSLSSCRIRMPNNQYFLFRVPSQESEAKPQNTKPGDLCFSRRLSFVS